EDSAVETADAGHAAVREEQDRRAEADERAADQRGDWSEVVHGFFWTSAGRRRVTRTTAATVTAATRIVTTRGACLPMTKSPMATTSHANPRRSALAGTLFPANTPSTVPTTAAAVTTAMSGQSSATCPACPAKPAKDWRAMTNSEVPIAW